MLSNHGLTGLVNLGNTCYMNTAIQCLSNTPELTDFFLSLKFQKNLNTEHIYINLITEWYKLMEAMWDENCTIIPKSFDITVKTYATKYGLNNNFTNYGQNDVQEFLIFIIDNMHEILSKKVSMNISGEIQNDKDKSAYLAMKNWEIHFKNNYSIIIDIFYGQLITTIESTTNDIISHSFDPICFYTLPIPPLENITIYNCFDLFCSKDFLTDDNKYYCDKTEQYYDAHKKTGVWKFPKILIVCFKRFNNNMRKINSLIDFPLSLDLNQYCEGYEMDNNFDLYGICNHSGGPSGGHYYSFCKNKNGNWYTYNDSSVIKMNEEDIITNSAYCLFYRKTNL